MLLSTGTTEMLVFNNIPNIRLHTNCDLLLKPNGKTVLNFKHVNRLFKIMKNADVPHLEVGVKNLALGGGRGVGRNP